MSKAVFQPVGQKRLTNVAVVRYKKHGKRFEIACYKNKVLNWRNGIEKDLDEVLQTTTVYSNVSKAILAGREDLKLVFGTDDEEAVCKFILANGDLQVSDRERKLDLDTKFRDVAAVISEKCINPTNSRPYTIPMIERALKDVHFSVDPNRPAKIQALEVLPSLQARFPIERARMKLRLTFPLTARDEVEALLSSEDKARIEESELVGSSMVTLCLADPGLFRPLHSVLASVGGRLEVVELAAHAPSAAGTDEIQAKLDSLSVEEPQAVGQIAEPRTSSSVPSTRHVRPSSSSLHRTAARSTVQASPEANVLYPRGPIAGLPEEFASRRERFAELDTLQSGWTIELSSKGDAGLVDAVFFSPEGVRVGAYVTARRQALQSTKARQ